MKNIIIGFLMFMLPVFAYDTATTFFIGIPMFFVTVNREYLKDKWERRRKK